MHSFIALADILLRRKRILAVKDNHPVSKDKKLIFLSELVSLGYEPTNTDKYNDSVLMQHMNIIYTLEALKAGHVKYVPLFSCFPEKTPSDIKFFSKRLFGVFSNVAELFTCGVQLDSGMYVPEWLFELSEFGANPITQYQDLGLFLEGIKNQEERKVDTVQSLTKLYFVSEQEAWDIGAKYLNELLSAKSSIKLTIKKDIETLLEIYGADYIESDNISFKETKAYVQKFFWNKGEHQGAMHLATTPTDILRLFAALTESDISLAEKIKFPKFSRPQRRVIMETLNNFPDLAESMQRYRGLWLAIGKYLHFGDFAGKYDNAVLAFSQMNSGKVLTWNSIVEVQMSYGSFDVDMLKKRPGEFARRLHAVLRRADKLGNTEMALEAFREVVEQVPLKNLLVLERYLQTIDGCTYRTVINKKGRIKVFENTLEKIGPVGVHAADIISNAIVKKISNEKPKWTNKKVWIDPKLKKYIVPLQQRKASETFITVGRGTRISFEDTKVIRLFVWWKEKFERTDLDLSVIKFDEDMSYQGHVSYTRLKDNGIVHSGDITSAPHGAAEFIDITIENVKGMGTRYIVPQIYRYAGDSFSQMDKCYAGWMSRNKVNSAYKSFDIKTVKNAFMLNGTASFCLPMIVDLKEMNIIYADLYVGKNAFYNRVENSTFSVSTIAKEIIKMSETKPNMFDLSWYNLKGRDGILVDNQKDADITIGITDCDFNATEIEAILSEFLI